MSDPAARLLDILDRIVAQARPGEGVEAYGVDETVTRVRAYEGDVESLTSARTRGIGVRVLADARIGYAYTADLDAHAVADTLEAARANATVGTRDEAHVLPQPQPAQDVPLYDPAFGDVPPEEKVALALRLEAAARAGDARVKGVDSATYGDAERAAAIASSTGVRGAYRRCDAYVLVEVLAAADGATTSAFGLDYARLPGDLDIEAAAAEGVLRATRLLGGRKPDSGRIPVVLDPFAAAAVLGVVAGGLTAEAVQKGRSMFAGRVGERLAPSHVTLVDDGRLPDGPAAAPWDDEGTPTQRTVLLRDGVLEGFLHNAYTAAKSGGTSTGNAQRGFRSPPGVGPSNLYLEPGPVAAADLIAGIDDGFYCQQVLGVHSGANPVSGDFSVGAAGLRIRGGQLAEPVREATVAGTIPQILGGLVAVSSELRFLPFGGGMGGATLVVDGMTLSGA